MELKVYTEHLKPEAKDKQLRHICMTDFLLEIQGLMNTVFILGGSVTYFNSYKGHQAITLMK